MSNFSSPQFDAAAVAPAKHLPVESAMPGTTLQLIPLNAFDSGGLLYGKPNSDPLKPFLCKAQLMVC